MGLGVNGTRFLLYAKQQGVDFKQTAMLGRQGLHIDPIALRAMLNEFNVFLTDPGIEQTIRQRDRDTRSRFWKCSGAAEICSFDASAFEGTTHVHDFNTPIEDRFKERYTVVFDGGSHEHIFNFPIAVRNCMEMLKVAGIFSPSHRPTILLDMVFTSSHRMLFFRIFNNENGFTIERVFLFEEFESPFPARWWRSTDPLILQRRATFNNTRPTYLLVLARRIAAVPIFATFPQQSDYAALWKTQRYQPLPLCQRPSLKQRGACQIPSSRFIVSSI